MIGDYATKPLQGALFRKFRDRIMGVTPSRYPGPGKINSGVGKTETSKTKKAAPQDCVGSRTRDYAKAEPGLVKKIADPAIFNQSSGKSVSIFPRGSRGPGKTLKIRSLLHLTSKGQSSKTAEFAKL
jgi:hypothetical protein